MKERLLPLRHSFLRRLEAARNLGYAFFRYLRSRPALAGTPTEFDGHRPYLPGDDTRWIDWNIDARSEELYLKVFQVEDEVEVVILLDVSPSMKLAGNKAQRVTAATAALSYLALLTDHPLSLLRYGGRIVDLRGPFKSVQAFPAIMKYLERSIDAAGTDLGSSLRSFLLSRSRPLSIVALTDGFQREPLEEAAETAKRLGDHHLRVIHLRERDDLRPRLRGQLLITDPEGNARRTVISDMQLERQLHHHIEKHFKELRVRLTSLGAEIVPLDGSEPFEDGFMKLLSACAHPREGTRRDA